jgi:hypothetical protein
MQILKRLCPISEMLKKSVTLTLTLIPTLTLIKKIKKPKKKRKRGKKRIIEKSLNELKLIFIAIIGAAVYRSLI